MPSTSAARTCVSAMSSSKEKVVSRSRRPSSACTSCRPALTSARSYSVLHKLIARDCRTEEQKQADAQGLFDFCAECLDNFVKDTFGDEDGKVELEEPIPMGFTFSYPCECVAP